MDGVVARRIIYVVHYDLINNFWLIEIPELVLLVNGIKNISCSPTREL